MCEGFSKFDVSSHGGFTAALYKYERFLCTEKNIEENGISTGYSRRNQGHRWLYEEDELCCRRYFETYVIEHKKTDLSLFAEKLSKELPDISVNSLRMKAQNIKYLCVENKIIDSLDVKPLSMFSSQNLQAFKTICREYNLK